MALNIDKFYMSFNQLEYNPRRPSEERLNRLSPSELDTWNAGLRYVAHAVIQYQ